MPTVALATAAAHADLLPDDRLAVEQLARLGIGAVPAVWSDATVAWDAFDAVVVRSCWDYFHRHDEFLAWIDRVERLGTPLWNPPSILRWNSSKVYLRELADRGIPVVPTRWVGPDDVTPLATILGETRWTDVVVKPVVSAGAHETWRSSPAAVAGDEHRFRTLASSRATMVQPYVPEVATAGEWSFLFFLGAFSHAVVKHPRAGDFRVQAAHGGRSRPVAPDRGLVDQARRVLDAVPAMLLYARVDGCVIDGAFHLMELEVLEPSLYLDHDAGAPARFARAIARVLAH